MDKKYMDKKIELIDNTFDANGLKSVLLTLISSKINYHQVNSLINLEKNSDTDVTYNNKRVSALTEEKYNLIQFANKFKDKKFKVKATILIELDE